MLASSVLSVSKDYAQTITFLRRQNEAIWSNANIPIKACNLFTRLQISQGYKYHKATNRLQLAKTISVNNAAFVSSIFKLHGKLRYSVVQYSVQGDIIYVPISE